MTMASAYRVYNAAPCFEFYILLFTTNSSAISNLSTIP